MSSIPPIPEDLAQSIAESMDAEYDLVPFLADLLADLEDLGARAEDVLRIVAEAGLQAGLQAGARVLDMGSGKGAAAIAIAQQYEVDVLGLDAHPDFVTHANQRAQLAGVQNRCRFEVADVALFEPAGERDLLLYLAMGDLLGDTGQTLGALRRHVAPGGHILIDDAYLATPTQAEAATLEAYAPRASVAEELEQFGDAIVATITVDGPDTHDHYRRVTDLLRGRAHALAAAYPEVAEAALLFADEQTSQLAYLDSPVTGALWLLRRA